MNYTQLMDRLEYIEVMQQVALNDNFTVAEARQLYREREALVQKINNLDLVGHKQPEPKSLRNIIFCLLFIVFAGLVYKAICAVQNEPDKAMIHRAKKNNNFISTADR